MAPQAASAETPVAAAAAAATSMRGGESLDAFYAARDQAPLWLAGDGRSAQRLIDLLRSAEADGLDTNDYPLAQLDDALRAARDGDISDGDRADRLLSQAFVAFVRDQKRSPRIDMIWVDPQLRPASPSPRRLLEAAAAAPSLDRWLAEMGWMHPLYAGLRAAIADGAADPARRELLRLNLERARALPSASGRHVVVNASSATLAMYDNGRIVDTMRVVVGKPVHSTPMMAALIRFTSLNPYWNVPSDLAAERIAPNVVKGGTAYLQKNGYQLLSSWAEDATAVDPSKIDWPAVVAGRTQVRLRQLPGPGNAMGNMKFMFPNVQGIYLHDTPQKELLTEASRMFSGGCVRLEDAPRLARWLYGGSLPSTRSVLPEQRVDLPRPVPVFITYLTATPEGGEIAYYPDVYSRDGAAMAQLGGPGKFAGR